MGELIFMLSWGHHDCIRASGQRRNECLTRALRGLVRVNTHPQGIKTVVPPPQDVQSQPMQGFNVLLPAAVNQGDLFF